MRMDDFGNANDASSVAQLMDHPIQLCSRPQIDPSPSTGTGLESIVAPTLTRLSAPSAYLLVCDANKMLFIMARYLGVHDTLGGVALWFTR